MELTPFSMTTNRNQSSDDSRSSGSVPKMMASAKQAMQ